MEEAKSVGICLILSILTAIVFLHSRMFAFLAQNQRRRPPPLPQPGHGPGYIYFLTTFENQEMSQGINVNTVNIKQELFNKTGSI